MAETKLKPRQVEIMQIALELLSEGGCHALTIRGIAEHLGISEPAIYRHFSSKKELLQSLYSYVWSRLKDEVLPLVDAGENAPQRLRQLMEAILGFLEKNRGITLVLLSEAIHHNDPDLKEAMFQLITSFQGRVKEILQAGIEEGSLVDGLDLDIASRAVIGFIQSTVILSLLKENGWNIAEMVDEFLEIVLKGMERR
jgi:AcrR family transcriptional regulator